MEFSDVNEAYFSVYNSMRSLAQIVETRNGKAMRISHPVLLVHKDPMNNVLFCANRDANPFFHMYEAVWMLAGRQDVEKLSYYSSNIAQFSDDGLRFHGAYGHRWRHRWSDQVQNAIDSLHESPESRRVVISMYDPQLDMEYATIGGKDVPCNTHLYLTMREHRVNMTVCNRSNDLVWGMLGANIVHFSFLLEHIAYHLGAEVGILYQFSNDLHLYERHWDLEPAMWDPYPTRVPVDADIKELMKAADAHHQFFQSRWLTGTYKRAMQAFDAYKEKNYNDALVFADRIESQDWRKACTEWLLRRKRKYESRNPYYQES